MNSIPHYGLNTQNRLIILFAVVAMCACQHKTVKNKLNRPLTSREAEFSKKLQTLIPAADTAKPKGIGSVDYNIRLTYQLNEYLPLWVKDNYAPTDAAKSYLAELEGVWQDGIDPEKYKLAQLKALMLKLGGKSTTVTDAIAFDTLLTRSYLAVAKDLLLGQIVPKKADSLWYHANDSLWDAPKVLATMQARYFPINDYRSDFPTYPLLRDEFKRYHDLLSDSGLVRAIQRIGVATSPDSEDYSYALSIIAKEMPWVNPTHNDTVDAQTLTIQAYQYYQGLKVTGELDTSTMKRLAIGPDNILKKLGANMERIRWMKQKTGAMYIVVNVPQMEFFFRRDGAEVMHMRVVVGKPVRQTPSLNALMSNIVMNPQWGVPPTILKQDVLPGLEKSGKKYLAKKGLKVYDKNGNLVNASMVTASNYRRFKYRQAPGDDNALGYIKFNLPNPWDIYLHDTPHRGDFVKNFRALSSGCIRLQHPEDLALYIFNDLEKKNFTKEKLDSMEETHKTQWYILKNKFPVNITYFTTFEDSTHTHIRLLGDVYHRDEKLIGLLSKSK